MPNINKTEIVVILDRSGSMAGIREDMEGGLRAFVEGQRKEPGECALSLFQFDDKFEVVCEAKPLDQVSEIALWPRGATALLDGVGKTIALVSERHDKLADSDKPGAVIVVVITDGHENASVEWRLSAVRKAVERAEKERNWRFVFLGADANAFAEAGAMGIGASAAYTASARGVAVACEELSEVARKYRKRARSGEVHALLEIKKDLRVEDEATSGSGASRGKTRH